MRVCLLEELDARLGPLDAPRVRLARLLPRQASASRAVRTFPNRALFLWPPSVQRYTRSRRSKRCVHVLFWREESGPTQSHKPGPTQRHLSPSMLGSGTAPQSHITKYTSIRRYNPSQVSRWAVHQAGRDFCSFGITLRMERGGPCS